MRSTVCKNSVQIHDIEETAWSRQSVQNNISINIQEGYHKYYYRSRH